MSTATTLSPSISFLRPGTKQNMYGLFVVCLLAYLFAALSSASDSYNGPFVLMPEVSGFLIGLSYVALLGFGISMERAYTLSDITQIFRIMAVGGLLTLTINLISLVFGTDGSAVFMSEVYPVISGFFFLLFFAVSFAFFYKLISERNRRVDRYWSTFCIILALSAFTAIFPLPGNWPLVIYAIAAVPALFLLFKVKWIALLDASQRMTSIMLLFLITWACIGLFSKFFMEDVPGIFHAEVTRNVFPILLMSFVGGYSLTSLLSMVFNLPISDVIERRNREISHFKEINRSINDMATPEDIQELLYEICMKNSLADGGWLTRPVETNNAIQVLKSENLRMDQVSKLDNALKQEKYQESAQHNRIYIGRPLRRYAELTELLPGFRSMLAFPITINGSYLSNLVLVKNDRDAFDDYSIHLLGTYVDQARLAIEKNKLVEEAVETERLRNDLEIAKQVQTSLLPQRAPTVDWVSLAIEYSPASEVGGDYYDYIEDGNKFHLVVGDVSGKGMSAAFNVAEVKGIFHSQRHLIETPAEFVYKLNEGVSICFDQKVFLTLIYLAIDESKNTITYSRAGHCPILYYKAEEKEASFLDDKGLGLGIIRSEAYRSHVHVNELRFNSNDIMVLYSDGVLEAMKEDTREAYGYERLQKVVARHAFFTADDIKNKILDDVREFLDGGPVGDDITLVVIKFR